MSLASLPFDGVAGLLRDVLDRFVPDPKDKLAALEAAQSRAFELAKMQAAADAASDQAQASIDQADAASGSNYRGGWRPAVGWSCAIGFAVQFVAGPLAAWCSALAGHPLPSLPALDAPTLATMLGTLLGVGTLRTIEKVKGAA